MARPVNNPFGDAGRGRQSTKEKADDDDDDDDFQRPVHQSLRSSQRRALYKLAETVRRRKRERIAAAAADAATAVDLGATTQEPGHRGVNRPSANKGPKRSIVETVEEENRPSSSSNVDHTTDEDDNDDTMETGGSAGGSAAQNAPAAPVRPNVPDIYAPQVFKGETCEDAEQWIEHFARYVKCRNLTADEQKDFFPLFLRGNALDWYNGVADEHKATIDGLVEAFKNYYQPTSFDVILDDDSLFSRSQKAGERTRDFVAAIQKAARRVANVTDDTVRCLIVRGLLPHIKRHVVEQNAQTIDDILKFARAAELSSTSAPVDANIGDLLAEVKASHQEMRELAAKVNRMTVNAVVSPRSRSPTPDRRTPPAGRRVTFQHNTQQCRDRPPPQQEWSQTRWRPSRPTTTRSLCYRCGKDHLGSPCKFVNLTCFKCNRRGHASVCCRTGRRGEQAQK